MHGETEKVEVERSELEMQDGTDGGVRSSQARNLPLATNEGARCASSSLQSPAQVRAKRAVNVRWSKSREFG
jgi:hypothetical protein